MSGLLLATPYPSHSDLSLGGPVSSARSLRPKPCPPLPAVRNWGRSPTGGALGLERPHAQAEKAAGPLGDLPLLLLFMEEQIEGTLRGSQRPRWLLASGEKGLPEMFPCSFPCLASSRLVTASPNPTWPQTSSGEEVVAQVLHLLGELLGTGPQKSLLVHEWIPAGRHLFAPPPGTYILRASLGLAVLPLMKETPGWRSCSQPPHQ